MRLREQGYGFGLGPELSCNRVIESCNRVGADKASGLVVSNTLKWGQGVKP